MANMNLTYIEKYARIHVTKGGISVNLFISDMDKKDVEHFTSNIGLKLRKVLDKPFKKLCNISTNANIIRMNNEAMSDEEYFNSLDFEQIPLSNYKIVKGKNNIIVERYPKLDKDEPYIFVCNHTCPEDIETVLNIIDRNAYLVLGSIETLKYNPEMYLTWLNGMIPFDILDDLQRKEVTKKMERVLKTNSILIFPEGSHNYHPNKIINNLFDGPVNLSLKTGRKIVVITLVKDKDNNISYIDVSNPISAEELDLKEQSDRFETKEQEKQYVKHLSLCLRDKMATAVYHIMSRHFNIKVRNSVENIEEFFRQQCVLDAFKQMKWNSDVFDAEYLVKMTKEEKEYEAVVRTISNLRFNYDTLIKMRLTNRNYVLQEMDLQQKNVVIAMRRHLNEIQNSEENVKRK